MKYRNGPDKNRLRQLRFDRGRMTQLFVAQRAKLQVARLSVIENGHVDPTPTEQEKLAKFFKLPIADIFPNLAPAAPKRSADEAAAS